MKSILWLYSLVKFFSLMSVVGGTVGIPVHRFFPVVRCSPTRPGRCRVVSWLSSGLQRNNNTNTMLGSFSYKNYKARQFGAQGHFLLLSQMSNNAASRSKSLFLLVSLFFISCLYLSRESPDIIFTSDPLYVFWIFLNYLFPITSRIRIEINLLSLNKLLNIFRRPLKQVVHGFELVWIVTDPENQKALKNFVHEKQWKQRQHNGKNVYVHTMVEPPLPISNREVKHHLAELVLR